MTPTKTHSKMERKQTTIWYKRTNSRTLNHTFPTKKDASAFIRDLQRLDQQARWSYEPFE